VVDGKLGYPIGFEVGGPLGMYADMTTGSEAVSYPFPPPCSAIGMIESICRLRGVSLKIVATAVCQRWQGNSWASGIPRWTKYSYNSFSISRKPANFKKQVATQLHETVLERPRFQILALAFNGTNPHPKYKEINGAHSFQEQFFRRLMRGQNFHPVCLGRKEHLCNYVGVCISPVEERYNVILPTMLFSVFDQRGMVSRENVVTKQNVEVRNGVIHWIEGLAGVRDGKLALIGNNHAK